MRLRMPCAKPKVSGIHQHRALTAPSLHGHHFGAARDDQILQARHDRGRRHVDAGDAEQHRQSPEGNRRHCGHTPLRMRLGAKCEPEAQKCSHSTRVLKKLYPSRASTAGRMGNVPDTGVHVRTMCSKILLLGPLDVARRNQSNRMPKLHQLASPVMGRRARLHTNKTRGKPPEDPISAGGEVAERAQSCPDRTPNEITKEGAYDE